MDQELQEQLQAALGEKYRIVRELGGGGMSRVFLADDLALNRQVVIKVLHPELAAGVNADRFNREVQLSARLQHPHIVPVLTAGDIRGLPYYVMPYVKGDTLRARIDAGQMSFQEITGILGDVAKALGYAHAEDVIHRDIKPENILLSGGAATVADFGIAKAISSARRNGESGLTSVGTSLGTPAYMAPEQVAGDPDTDHRADIYSLGCVAYEMVTGKAPFAGKSPQQMLAAQVMEQPVPIASHRQGVPVHLVNVVNRSLHKDPARRPQTAGELLELLDTPDVPMGRASGKWSRAPFIAALVMVVAVVAGVIGYRRTHAPVVNNGAINLAVAPFEVLDPQLALWKEGIVDVLARNLDGAGPIKSISPSVTIKAWGGHAEHEAAVAFGKKVGAQLVIYGQLQAAGPGMVSAKLWIADTEQDQAPLEVSVSDSAARMDRVTDSLSFRALAAIGRLRTIGAARLASLGSSSLPAIRSFLQGAQYFRRAQWDSAAISLNQAVATDTTFGIAYAMLGEAYGWIGENGSERQFQAFEAAGRQARPGLSPHDSLTLVAVSHYAKAVKGAGRAEQMREAYAAAEAVVARYPDDAAAQYLYADMRFHNDRNLSQGDALAGFDKAIRADSDFAPAYIHAIELAYRNGNAMGNRYIDAYLARPLSTQQKDAAVLARRLVNGELRGDAMTQTFAKTDMMTGQSALSFLRRSPDSAEVVIDLLRAALKRIPPGAKTELPAIFTGELSYRGHIREAFRTAIETPSYAAAEIVALGLVPADSGAKLIGPWIKRRDDASFYVLPVLAAAHDTTELRRIIAGVARVAKGDTSTRQRSTFAKFAQVARAYEKLAAGDTAAATPLFDALSDTVFNFPIDQFIRARLIARSNPQRALTLLERNTQSIDVIAVASELERGRIAERIGQTQRAVEAYAFVAEAWRNTDSQQLRNAVNEASAGLKRLDGDGRLRRTVGTSSP